jgi:hypothetical protein
MNDKQTFLTLSELGKFLESKGSNLYLNANGIEISLTDTVLASMVVWSKEPMQFILSAEFLDTDPELFGKMNLSSVEDLDRIDEAEVWGHYQAGNGYVFVQPEEVLDISIEFAVVGGRTQIKTVDSPFLDHVDEVWDNVTAFRDYIRNNIRNIYIAAEQNAEKL